MLKFNQTSFQSEENDLLFSESAHATHLPIFHHDSRQDIQRQDENRQLAHYISKCGSWLMPIIARLPSNERFREFENIATIMVCYNIYVLHVCCC